MALLLFTRGIAAVLVLGAVFSPLLPVVVVVVGVVVEMPCSTTAPLSPPISSSDDPDEDLRMFLHKLVRFLLGHFKFSGKICPVHVVSAFEFRRLFCCRLVAFAFTGLKFAAGAANKPPPSPSPHKDMSTSAAAEGEFMNGVSGRFMFSPTAGRLLFFALLMLLLLLSLLFVRFDCSMSSRSSQGSS